MRCETREHIYALFRFATRNIRCVFVWCKHTNRVNHRHGRHFKRLETFLCQCNIFQVICQTVPEIRTLKAAKVRDLAQLTSTRALNKPYITHTQISLFAKRNIVQNNGRFVSTRMVYLCIHPDYYRRWFLPVPGPSFLPLTLNRARSSSTEHLLLSWHRHEWGGEIAERAFPVYSCGMYATSKRHFGVDAHSSWRECRK